jgi:hypothetical protein
VIYDPPGGSYFEAILVAIRGAGQRMMALGGYLGSAEQASNLAWKWQLLAAAGDAHADALARLDEAEERLGQLGGQAELPPPLDQLPERLKAMRADLRAAGERIQKAVAEAAARPAGSA